jgi:hypothetical protein
MLLRELIICCFLFAENSMHAHMTFALIERSSLDGCYVVKPLKQKQFVHGLSYLLQEIYGIENKNNEKVKVKIYVHLFFCVDSLYACHTD